MIRVIIGDVESELKTINESWINQQINRRKADAQSICVRVIIHQGNLNMTLTTPACALGQPGRTPNAHEADIFDLWERCGLNKQRFTGGNLISFLKKIKTI
jgi:hypothetical protein